LVFWATLWDSKSVTVPPLQATVTTVLNFELLEDAVKSWTSLFHFPLSITGSAVEHEHVPPTAPAFCTHTVLSAAGGASCSTIWLGGGLGIGSGLKSVTVIL
jgi:hypothetical protein